MDDLSNKNNLGIISHEDEHCSKGALTGIFGWLLQFILASLAFTCLIGEYVVVFFTFHSMSLFFYLLLSFYNLVTWSSLVALSVLK